MKFGIVKSKIKLLHVNMISVDVFFAAVTSARAHRIMRLIHNQLADVLLGSCNATQRQNSILHDSNRCFPDDRRWPLLPGDFN